MIKSYSKYVDKLNIIDSKIKEIKRLEKTKERIEDKYKESFISDVILELSKYYDTYFSGFDDDIRNNFANRFGLSYIDSSFNKSDVWGVSFIHTYFIIDRNYCFVLSVNPARFYDFEKYSDLKVDINKGIRRDNVFQIYKNPFFSIGVNDDISLKVGEFRELFDKSISEGKRKKDKVDALNKYNL